MDASRADQKVLVEGCDLTVSLVNHSAGVVSLIDTVSAAPVSRQRAVDCSFNTISKRDSDDWTADGILPEKLDAMGMLKPSHSCQRKCPRNSFAQSYPTPTICNDEDEGWDPALVYKSGWSAMIADVDVAWLMSPNLARREADSSADDEEQDDDSDSGTGGEEKAADEHCGPQSLTPRVNQKGAPATTWWQCWWLAVTSVIPAIRRGRLSVSTPAAPPPASDPAHRVRSERIGSPAARDKEDRAVVFRTHSPAPVPAADGANDENQAANNDFLDESDRGAASSAPIAARTYAHKRGKVSGNRRRRLYLD